MSETCSIQIESQAHQQDAFHCPAHTFLLVPASCGHIALLWCFDSFEHRIETCGRPAGANISLRCSLGLHGSIPLPYVDVPLRLLLLGAKSIIGNGVESQGALHASVQLPCLLNSSSTDGELADAA